MIDGGKNGAFVLLVLMAILIVIMLFLLSHGLIVGIAAYLLSKGIVGFISAILFLSSDPDVEWSLDAAVAGVGILLGLLGAALAVTAKSVLGLIIAAYSFLTSIFVL